MAPKKLSAKRSRRDVAAEGPSAAPEFDSHRFRSVEHQQRFEAIKGWSFHRKSRIQLRDDDNVLPRDHNSDLPLPKCQLVYAILTRMSVHVAQLIADAIYLFAGMPPTWHLLDPDKSNRALGFPTLITSLC
ncbi:hypothetical protein HKD37_08G023044 [Glycine soja]